MRTIVRFRWWCLFLLAAGLALLASFCFDADAQAWIAEHQSAGLRNFMRGVSRFGDWPEHVILGLTLLALAYWRRNKKWMRIFAAMILACALAGAAARVIKISTGRARPSVQTEAEWNGPDSVLATTRFRQATLRLRLRSSRRSHWPVGGSASGFWRSRC